jgi:hypothetical protein
MTFSKNLLALAVLGLLSACGGGNSADAVASSGTTSVSTTTPGSSAGTTVVTPTIAVTGKVLNVGYLGNTQVCADVDGDGLCGASEPSATSADDGSYALTVPTGHRGINLLAVVRPASVDSASTTAAPITFTQGWTMAMPLEYEDDATTLAANITPITSTYYARMHVQGRSRLSNQIAMFTRIVFEPNTDTTTGKLLLPVDFDYVANPRNTLATRLAAISAVLSTRAGAAAAPLDLVNTSAVLYSWYSSYTAPTGTTVGIPVDASKIATYASTSTSSPAYYLAQNFHYFKLNTEAAVRLREGITDTAGWVRATGQGALATLDRRGISLANGSMLDSLARWASGVWTALTVDEGSYLTLNTAGSAVLNSGTDYLQPRTITYADGNRITARMPNSGTRWALDVSDNPATNFYIEEWVGEQRDYTTYYNGTVPSTPKVSAGPSACNKGYTGAPQTGTNTTNGVAIGTTASQWYATCFDYYTAEYYATVKGDLALTGVDASLPGGNFYDVTFKESQVVAPLTQSCGTTAIPLAKVTVLGTAHCNWAVDANAGHTLADLFASGGVTINSWSKVYGSTTLGTTVRTAGDSSNVGLPQQLTLKLTRTGSETSGTGTLTSPYGAWTSTSYTSTTETIQWAISPETPNMVLVSWPFRDAGDPRVKSTQASDGSTSPAAPVLPAGQFSAVYTGNTFSAAPSTRTAPNYRKLAIVLQDGVFVTGQYYGKGYVGNERRFTLPAMEQGIAVMNYVFAKLYAAGFTD